MTTSTALKYVPLGGLNDGEFTASRPLTRTGEVRLAVDPSPSSPSKFRPHVQTEPSFFSATPCSLPPPTPTTPPRFGICCGGEFAPKSGPCPSWPKPLLPHDQTPPLFVTARTNSLPAEISVISVESPVTFIGAG